MSTFDDREKAFENKYAHDTEMQFRAEARRNRLLGLWAAEKFGLSADDAAAYAKSVVVADLTEAGDEDVFRKVAGDLKEKGVSLPDEEIRRQMRELLAKAKSQLLTEVRD